MLAVPQQPSMATVADADANAYAGVGDGAVLGAGTVMAEAERHRHHQRLRHHLNRLGPRTDCPVRDATNRLDRLLDDGRK